MRILQATIIALCLCLGLCVSSYGGETHSGRAITEAGRASTHSAASVAHSLAGSAQVVSGAVAVPLSVSGAAGAVSSQVAEELMEAATAPATRPLRISDETVTAGPPPDVALELGE